MINVAIAGCGSITKYRHAPEYAADSRVTIKGFFDAMEQRAENLAEEYKCKVYHSFDEILCDEEIDAISICTANKYHAEMTIKALKAKKHVLCEKPMAISEQEALNMIETAKQENRFLMIGHNQRLNRTHKKAKQILQRGDLGKILSFRTEFAHKGPESWSADKSASTWFFDKTAAKLGAMCDLGIHKADVIRWLIDDEIVRVSAYLRSLDKKDCNGDPITLDDNGFCILESENGIIGSMIASWTNYGREENSIVLYCQNGRMRIFDDSEYSIVIDWKNGESEYYKVEQIQTNDNQTESGVIKQFVDCIEKGISPEIDGYEGLEALKIVLACLESSQTGRSVSIAKTNRV